MSGGNDKIDVNVRGSHQHLWNLLKGGLMLVTEDVILEELRESLDRLMSGLTYYTAYEGGENDTEIKFPSAPSFARSALFLGPRKNSKNDTLEGSGKGQESKQDADKKKEPEKSAFEKSNLDMIRKAVAQRLNLNLEVATDLVVSYMMYEYKGISTSYEEIADTQASFNIFFRDLKNYYQKERICLLLCTQAILAELGDEEHRFFTIIESFRTLITYKKWCWGLLRSINVAQDESEIVEILHCLALLMYKLPNETIPEFFTYFTKSGFDKLRESERTRMAEATAVYTAVMVSGITDCCNGVFPQEFSGIIQDFLSQNFNNLLDNPYNHAAFFASYDIFCKEDPEITNKMKRIQVHTAATFNSMLTLVEHYGKNSLRDRHSLSLVVATSVFEAFEAILANYDISHFGTNKEAFDIFAKILQHNLVAENFLCGTPLALTALYADATTLFPLDIPSTLHLWRSLCMSVRSVDLCNTIVRGVAKMNGIAEYVTEERACYIRRVSSDRLKVENLKTRSVYGVTLQEGVTGMLNLGRNPYVVWELPTSLEVSAFDILRWSLQPIADTLLQMLADNAPLEEYQQFYYAPNDLHAISEFAIQFWKTTDEQVSGLTNLIHPACLIMETMLKHKVNFEERLMLIQDLFGVVSSVNEFHPDMVLQNYIYDIIPGNDNVSLVEELIMGHESVSSTKCQVTLSLLSMVSSFAQNSKCWQQGHYSVFETKFLRCIHFIASNIVPKASRWRVENDGIRLEIYSKCLQIFIQIFSLEGVDWLELKRNCMQYLINHNSFLIVLLKTEESKLVSSVIQPTENNKTLSSVLSLALRLLLRLIRFDFKILKQLNLILEGLLVRMLGKFVRHRLIPAVPTLSIMILTEVAKGSSLSLLACFGKDEAAFRDVIVQRLEFASEDVNLKIAVLDFLTVIAQTQVGIIECFFADGVLEDNILSLIHESEELAVACLRFFRSLFRQGLPCPRHREEFWRHILEPINSVKRGCKLEVITATLHILTFEMYVSGLSERSFSKPVETLLRKDEFKKIIETIVCQSGESTVRCLSALKHFLTLILGRPELARLVQDDTLEHLQGVMLQTFLKANPRENERLCTTIAELLIIVTTPQTSSPSVLSILMANLVENFRDHTLSTQLPLLCLMNKCFALCKGPIGHNDVESTFRILKRVLDVSAKRMEASDADKLYPILSVSAGMISTIVENHHIDLWGLIMQKELIPMSLIIVTSVAINKRACPNVVASCLAALITLAEHPHGCMMIPTDGLTKGIYVYVSRFQEEARDDAWSNIFFLCLNLNSRLLGNRKQDYLDEALAFWGQNSVFLNQQLSIVANLTEKCVGVEDPAKGYNEMKAALSSAAFILNDILMLTRYIQKWQAAQPSGVYLALKNVFFILQEASGLMQSPYLLQSSLGQTLKAQSSSSLDLKPSPKLQEMQLKLLEICDICMHIFVSLKSNVEEFGEKNGLMPTFVHIGLLILKSTNTGDRKTQSANMTNRASSVLEKVVIMIHRYTSPIMDDPAVDHKFQTSFRREWGIDILSICDGIRRLTVPKNEFLISLCQKLEVKFK